MANYYATCRTNYFDVKDKDAFLSALSGVPDIEVDEGNQGFVILGCNTDGAGWPQWVWDEDTNEDYEIDLPMIVAEHLADDSVAIFMEAGAEKCRFIIGYAEAINNKFERETISLGDIYQRARSLGSNVTPAEY